MVFLFLLQLGVVQTFLADKVLASISTKTNHEISIQKVNITWLDRATLEDLVILDSHQDTMIYMHKLRVNYEILDLLQQDFLKFEEISSEHAVLNLTRYDSLSKLNLSEFVLSFKNDATAKKNARKVGVESIVVEKLMFNLNDLSKERRTGRTDFNHLTFEVPSIVLEEFRLASDTVMGNLIRFSGIETNSSLEIKAFSSRFRLSNSALSLDDLDFQTPYSLVQDSIELFYNGLDDLGSFVDSVSFVMHFTNSTISHRDIKLITGVDELQSDISLNGIFWGTVGDFNIEDARIGLGRNTYLQGGLSCFGLPDRDKTFLLADILDSHLEPDDLEPYIGAFTDNLRQMGRIDFTGSFAGFLNDFVAKGDFYTDQGSVHSDINLKIPDDPNYMSYRGNIELDELNVGSFFKNNIVQKVNLAASITGSGITPYNADFDLNALVTNSNLNNYVYDSVYLNGHFQNSFFRSKIEVKDANCNLKGSAELDMRDGREFADVDIVIENILTDTLNLTPFKLAGKGHIDLVLNNFAYDDFEGELKMDSMLVALESSVVPLDSVRISSRFAEDSTRQISLSVPGLNADVSGEFLISDLIRDIPLLVNGFSRRLFLTDQPVADSSLQSMQDSHSKINAVVELTDVQPYLDSLAIPLKLSRGSFAELSYRNSKSSHLTFYYEADSVSIYGNKIIHPVLEVNGSTNTNLEHILTNFIFRSSSQQIQGIPGTESMLLEGVWYDNAIRLSTLVAQPSSSSDVRLESQLLISKDSMVFNVLPSDIVLLNDAWEFNPANTIVFKANQTRIQYLEIFDQSESIRLSGTLAQQDSSRIEVLVEDLNMDKVNLFSESPVEGFLNGNFDVFRGEQTESAQFEGGFFLKNLTYDGILIGDVSGSSTWSQESQSIRSLMEVTRDEFKSIEVKGRYFPLRPTEQLDFDITFDQADLILARPFVEENFSNLHGAATGLVKLKGTVDDPALVGSFEISNGGGIVNYLNTEYSFEGDVEFDLNTISIPEVVITDRKGAKAQLGGKILHESFKDFRTVLSMKASNFEFLNTTSLDNSLYYGSAYGTGEINISGPLDDLVIKANVQTDPNTRVFIPVSETTNTTQESYIQFVNFADSSTLVVNEAPQGISGLTLDFDIDVTEDAYCELIFDIKKGDIIRGRGRGNLKLRLNTDGEFSMFGPLEIVDGAYNFTLSNLINKEFSVIPGSRIVWYGDPYDATLALEATYLQRASFEELKPESERDEDALTRKIPVLAVLNMTGSMLSPSIDFNIRLEDEGDASNDVVGTLSRISNDEQELRRQFISLLFLRRFSPFESFSLGSGDGISGSVSEILSNQVSYLVSQIDENLEIEVDLASLDEQAFNTFQLRLAYTLLDGRLKLTRGGGFGTNTQQENQNPLNSIVGDWSVEYSLTSDGRLRAKVFQNTTNSLVGLASSNLAQETGISLRFVHSFNDLKELLSSARQDAIRRREEELESRESSDLNTGSR